ncbi:hypothetical protein O6H91_14G015200 [Diphasiastrum complanatum]|uniref:Uncharacterized protein n=1 Tax=Diphasiastrum complanatum TaxID=34168 RepID=A0ACC2BLS1_DIPCM|nr:hypothetical protein O6H91_14G015200 [Diphasiastrum complanatum]
MARDPAVAMDFMGVGKNAGARESQGNTHSDRATPIRPTPTFLSFNDQNNWQSNLSVTAGVCLNSPNQLRRILPQGAPAAFGPAVALVKGKGWPLSEVKEDMLAGGIPIKQYAFSEKLSLDKPLVELIDPELVQLEKEDSRRHLYERALQQVLSVKDHFDLKYLGEKECYNEGGASTKYCTHSAAEISFPQSQDGPRLTSLQNPKFFGNSKCELSQPADKVYASACPDNDNRLIGSELTLSLASAWDKGLMVSEREGLKSFLPASLASTRGSPLSAIDADQQTTGKSVSPQLSIDCGPRSNPSHARPLNAPLTIFYSGLVNVYDDVPVDKAQAIMLLAGTGSSQPSLMNIPDTVDSSSVPLGTGPTVPVNSSICDQSQDLVPPTLPPPAVIQQAVRRSHTELPQARKASLQRFLEKRKERAIARAPVMETKSEIDGSSPIWESRENSPNPCKAFEAGFDSPIPSPFLSQLPARINKRSHSSGSEPSSPSIALRVPQHNVLDEQETKEATKLLLEKETLSLKRLKPLEEKLTEAQGATSSQM